MTITIPLWLIITSSAGVLYALLAQVRSPQEFPTLSIRLLAIISASLWPLFLATRVAEGLALSLRQGVNAGAGKPPPLKGLDPREPEIDVENGRYRQDDIVDMLVERSGDPRVNRWQ